MSIMSRTEITDEVFQQYMEGIRAKEKIIIEIRSRSVNTPKCEVRAYHIQKKSRRSSVANLSVSKASPSQKKKASRFA